MDQSDKSSKSIASFSWSFQSCEDTQKVTPNTSSLIATVETGFTSPEHQQAMTLSFFSLLIKYYYDYYEY